MFKSLAYSWITSAALARLKMWRAIIVIIAMIMASDLISICTTIFLAERSVSILAVCTFYKLVARQ